MPADEDGDAGEESNAEESEGKEPADETSNVDGSGISEGYELDEDEEELWPVNDFSSGRLYYVRSIRRRNVFSDDSTMLTHFIASLLHLTGARSIPMPFDTPFAATYIPTTACDLPLGSTSFNRSIPDHGRDNFTQLIHHADPTLGLFSQAFLWNSTFWRPEAPIVLFLPGESPVDKYGIYSRADFSTIGVIAENLGAATIILEHRYFGSSLPYRSFTKANLQYLTVDNALKDVVRFANNFVAPWTDHPSTAKDVPWILIGGSYSAAQTGWIANIMPGTFWAYISASPILQAIPSYWAYFLPFMEHGPQSCVRLASSITQFIDNVIEAGDEVSLQILKTIFGLAEMKTPDFIYNLSFYWSEWGDIDIGQNNTLIKTYCAWVEGSEYGQDLEDPYEQLFHAASQQTNKSIEARADWATRLESTLRALQTYSAGFRTHLAPRLCIGGRCLDESFARLSEPLSSGQLYEWLMCNDMMGGYVTGAPIGTSMNPLVSRFLTSEYFQTRCSIVHSPGASGELEKTTSGHRSAEDFNKYTGGWFPTNARRIIYSAGEMDVWREISVSAKTRPGGPLQSDPESDVIVHLIKTGWHHSEMYTRNAELDEEVRRVRDEEVDQICRWVQQWPGYR
ncbi:serine peptidase like protein [Teratosphaeria destructans]|uniref:Serine peptidase like protein n=1 Tax=Teratosphaeria destructans TaxID=418781 RepID=A0A9W7W3P3_9PEZI|nr:serine peptidase like protein [Teratosphaeria destructans]